MRTAGVRWRSRRQLIDKRARKGGNVIRFAADDQLSVMNNFTNFTIFPSGASVFEIVPVQNA